MLLKLFKSFYSNLFIIHQPSNLTLIWDHFFWNYIFSASHPCITWDKNWKQNVPDYEHKNTTLQEQTLQEQTSMGGPSTIRYSPTIYFHLFHSHPQFPAIFIILLQWPLDFLYISIVITGTFLSHHNRNTLSVTGGFIFTSVTQWHTAVTGFFRTSFTAHFTLGSLGSSLWLYSTDCWLGSTKGTWLFISLVTLYWFTSHRWCT